MTELELDLQNISIKIFAADKSANNPDKQPDKDVQTLKLMKKHEIMVKALKLMIIVKKIHSS